MLSNSRLACLPRFLRWSHFRPRPEVAGQRRGYRWAGYPSGRIASRGVGILSRERQVPPGVIRWGEARRYPTVCWIALAGRAGQRPIETPTLSGPSPVASNASVCGNLRADQTGACEPARCGSLTKSGWGDRERVWPRTSTNAISRLDRFLGANLTETARGPRSSPKLRGPCSFGLGRAGCQIRARPGEVRLKKFVPRECFPFSSIDVYSSQASHQASPSPPLAISGRLRIQGRKETNGALEDPWRRPRVGP